MSEKTDERMDRARRIRQMREGTRDRVDDAADADGDAADGETTDGTDESTENDDAGVPDAADETPADDEATAAARRAARAASTVTGADDVDSVDGRARQDTSETESAATGTGIELPDRETVEAAVDDATAGDGTDAGGTADDAGGAADAAGGTTDDGIGDDADGAADASGTGSSRIAAGDQADDATTETTRVLEFTLGDEHYCIDIELVEEIVKCETVTRVPNTPDAVEGVVDLRGQITTVLDPTCVLAVESDVPEDLVVVFDPEAFDDQGGIGWVVDEVRRVVPVAESEVNDPPVDDDCVDGVVDRDGEFVVRTDPEAVVRAAGENDG